MYTPTLFVWYVFDWLIGQVEQDDFSDLENFRVEPLGAGNDAMGTVLPEENQNHTDNKSSNVRSGLIESLRNRLSWSMSSNDVSPRYPAKVDNPTNPATGPTMNKKDIWIIQGTKLDLLSIEW